MSRSATDGALPPAPRGAQDATRGGAVRLFVEIPIRALSILAILVLTHSLGVQGFGEFMVTLGVGLVISEFADLGLSPSLIRNVVSGAQSPRDIFVVKGQLTLATLGLGSVGLWILSLVTGIDSTTIGWCVLHYLGFGWIECIGSTLRAHGRVWAEASVLLVGRGTLVLLIGLTSLGSTPHLVAIAYAVAAIPGLLLSIQLVARHLVGDRASGSWVVLREALPLGLNGLLARLTVRIEVFVLAALGMATGVGLFAAGLRIIESVLTLPAAFSAGALPALTREASSRNSHVGAAQQTMGVLAWGAIPAATGLGMRAPEILSLLGAGFTEAGPILRIFSVTLAVCVLNTGLYYILVATSRAAVIPKFTALRVGVGVAFALTLIPRLGAIGAALGYAGAEVILLLCLAREARRLVRLSLVRSVGTALAGTVPMGIALWFGPRPLLFAIPMAVVILVLTAAFVFKARPEASGLRLASID